MKKAILVHIETGVEYYKNNVLYEPTYHEKLLWTLYGTPENVKKLEQTFETVLDHFKGKTKKEVQKLVDDKFKLGRYNYLPHIAANSNLELRWECKKNN